MSCGNGWKNKECAPLATPRKCLKDQHQPNTQSRMPRMQGLVFFCLHVPFGLAHRLRSLSTSEDHGCNGDSRGDTCSCSCCQPWQRRALPLRLRASSWCCAPTMRGTSVPTVCQGLPRGLATARVAVSFWLVSPKSKLTVKKSAGHPQSCHAFCVSPCPRSRSLLATSQEQRTCRWHSKEKEKSLSGGKRWLNKAVEVFVALLRCACPMVRRRTGSDNG